MHKARTAPFTQKKDKQLLAEITMWRSLKDSASNSLKKIVEREEDGDLALGERAALLDDSVQDNVRNEDLEQNKSLSSLLFDSDGEDERHDFLDESAQNRSGDSGQSRNLGAHAAKNVYVHRADDLDTFLDDVYQFYTHGGLGAFVLAKSTDVAKLVFVALLMYASLVCVNVDKALSSAASMEANGAHAHVSDFWQCTALPWWSYPLVAAFLSYALAMTWGCARQVHRMWSVRDFYQFELHIERVHAVRWCEVVQQLLDHDEMQRVGIGTSPLHVAMRLTRRANFLTALVSSDALAIPVPEQTLLTSQWTGLYSCSAIAHERLEKDERAAVHPIMTQSLEWALERTVFAVAFDPRGQLAPALRNCAIHGSRDWCALVDSLRARLRSLAILAIIFSPFVLCMLFVNFLLENGDQWRASRAKNVLTNRYWSPEARWLFRHYNELPHQCRRRLARAHNDTTRFLDNFARPKTAILARFAAFCVGSLIVSLLAFGFLYDDDALTSVDVALGRSAIWWIGVLSAAMAVLRAMVPDDNVVFEPRKHLREAVKHTHFMPRFWLAREHKPSVRRQMARMCEHHWTLWLRELHSVVMMPYLLWTVLPRRADAILRFIGRVAHTDERLGDICRMSSFQLADEAQRASATLMCDGSMSETNILFHAHQNGKTILSYLVFCHNYAQYAPSAHDDALCRTLYERVTKRDAEMGGNCKRQAGVTADAIQAVLEDLLFDV